MILFFLSFLAVGVSTVAGFLAIASVINFVFSTFILPIISSPSVQVISRSARYIFHSVSFFVISLKSMIFPHSVTSTTTQDASIIGSASTSPLYTQDSGNLTFALTIIIILFISLLLLYLIYKHNKND